ncbi:TatD family hydrolase [Oceanispirochaeta sp.]|jgi:TatD DNase family protein|uniref:TatD family hydrolase n=1 Tax=Oceanispirochaeta sp. TaxID=2035350 RepID=UPI00262DD5E0|nr:TatD family hydrolase [Oceanispirochaeta sp.]MDA3959025.1 TatD family hydrolase [Oceanispirochaeta sp.]
MNLKNLTNLINDCSFIDAHTHSDHYQGENRTGMLKEVFEHRILTLSSATDPDSIQESFSLNRSCPWILTAAGIHPWKAGIYDLEDLESLEEVYKMAHQISEIGMDSLWAPPEATWEKQSELLEAQLKLAVKHNKPVTLHTKGAEDRILTLLKKWTPPSILIHWFDGSDEQLKAFQALGCFFTVSPVLLTEPVTNRIISQIPLNLLLAETDNPPAWHWLFDQPPRAIQIQDVLQAASRILDIPIGELHEAFKDNLKTFFKIPPVHC